MLKLQHRGTSRSVWLVGPTMKVGAAKNCDLVILGEGVGDIHCLLHIDEDSISIEPQADFKTYLNDQIVTAKTTLQLADILKVGQREFEVVSPRQASNQPESQVVSELSAAKKAKELKASGWMLQGLHSAIQNKRFPIDGKVVLGRSKECDLHFSFERLSRRHAQLNVIDGNLLVEDLDSSNGTFHNGKRVKRAALSPGDTITFDKLDFTVLGKKEAKDDADTARWDNSLNQTVMRSAITPEMIEKANSDKKPRPSASHSTDNMITAKPANNSNSTILIAGLAIVVVALAAAVFLL